MAYWLLGQQHTRAVRLILVQMLRLQQVYISEYGNSFQNKNENKVEVHRWDMGTRGQQI
jgi:hypothetical protein